ncbi:transglutaminase-like domain-containing protein [Halocola ammonii]
MLTNELSALINLIEDPDEKIYSHVRSELLNYGESIIPHLEHFWEFHTHGELFQARVEQLIHSIHFKSVYEDLDKWNKEEDNDLLEGALIIHRYQFPSSDLDEFRNTISKIRQDIWLELNDYLTSFEKVRVFNHILFKEYGFKGNRADYTSTSNSFIGQVLESRTGNPLSLSIIYQVLANRLEVPIFGVNLPNHFVMCYLDEFGIGFHTDEVDHDNGILFYIDPFSEGAIIDRSEINEFLSHIDIDQQPRFFKPCSHRDMINRMLNNLIFSFEREGKIDKVQELRMLQGVL